MAPASSSFLMTSMAGRLANIVGVALEGQAQGGQPLAAQGPQRGAHLVEEDFPLGIVDLADLLSSWKSTPCCCATQ